MPVMYIMITYALDTTSSQYQRVNNTMEVCLTVTVT